MSRGPGKWQRAILATLADHEAFWLRSLLGPSCTKAQYNALLRAAHKLQAAGLVEIYRWRLTLAGTRFHSFGRGLGRTAVARVGTPPPDSDQVSVCEVPRWNLTHTYNKSLENIGETQNTGGNLPPSPSYPGVRRIHPPAVKTRDKIAAMTGRSATTIRKARVVVEAAEADPSLADILVMMDATGNVSAALREVDRRRAEVIRDEKEGKTA